MLTTPLHQNNKLIRKTILGMYPSSFAANLTTSVALMMDTILAGALLGQNAIAAVAIGLPAIGIFQTLTQTVTAGSAVKMAVHAGRGDQESVNRSFSLGLASVVCMGLFFILVCMTLADKLTLIFGGAGNPELARSAAIYLRVCSVRILMGSLNLFLGKIFALYGHQKIVFRSALVAMVGSAIFSALYVRLLPDQWDIAGLAAGAWSGGLCAVVSSILAMKPCKIPLRFRFRDVRLKDFPGVVRVGFPTSGNNLADNVVSGVVNNIIVLGFGGNSASLAVYTAVKAVFTFSMAAVLSTTTASAPLLGILYGSRDKNGILRTVKEDFKIGLAASAIWCCVLLICLPLLSRFYSMQGNSQFYIGAVVCMLFLPLHLCVRICVQLFESTEKIGMGLLYSIVPDSVIYPLMLLVLQPLLGYTGVWLSFAANALIFGLLLYLIRSLKNRSGKLNPERILCLDQSIRDHVPVLDISIPANNTDVTGISRRVHEFLLQENASGRTAYMTALCLEELAADFVAHTLQEGGRNAENTIMDIKLFSDTDGLCIIMRNAASPYNPLSFDLDDETFAKAGVKLVQKVSRRIDYNYFYKLNIITIELAK